MRRKPIPSKAILVLIGGGLVLPVAISVILALAALLAAMGDAIGGLVLQYVGLATGILWAILLICLLLAQGLNALADADPAEPPQGPEQ